MSEGLSLSLRTDLGSFRLEVDLEIAPGESMVLVGPSGSGKTTCLRTIAGLLRPQQGRVVVGGRTVLDTVQGLDLPPWRRRVGFVFQDYALFPHLTVEQNLLYGLRGRSDARRRVEEWLRILGLEALARRKPRELSGGQQQRVALARAAVTDADLLLLDEPFGSLDASTRRSVRSELRGFLARAQRTTLVVSHDYLDALTLGDRIAVLEEGRITQVGRRDEVLRRPRTPFLASLTGHNVLEGELLPLQLEPDLRAVRVGSLQFHVAGVGDLPAGPVFLSFGPHEVTLLVGGSGGSASPRNRFPAMVREIVNLPDRLRIYLEAGVPLMADIVRSAAEDLGVKEGASLEVAVKSTAIEVYR